MNIIRPIEPGDRAAFLSLMDKFYRSPAVLHPIPHEYFERVLNEVLRSDVYLEGFMLERDGETAGYGIISKMFSTEAGGLNIWLEELYILPEFRSLGLGGEYFSFIEARFKGLAKRFRLELEPGNGRALALYERLGFEPYGYLQMVKPG